MPLKRPITARLQSMFSSWPFCALFWLVLTLTGAAYPLLAAFVIASVAALLQSLVFNRVLPVPPKAAVLVTGCSSGIGRDAALRLLDCGFLVFATVRKQEDADALSSAHSSPLLVPVLCDVTSDESVAAATETVRRRLEQDGRRLLGLVSSAGYAEHSPLELLPLPALRLQLETNVIGSVRLVQALLPLLRSAASPAQSSRVVLVSSIIGRFAVPGLGAYAASKHALEAVGDALRVELQRWNVSVVLVEPGQIHTRFNDKVRETGAGWAAGDRRNALYAAAYDRFFHLLLPSDRVASSSDAVELALRQRRPSARITCGWTSLPTLPYRMLPTELADPIMGYAYRK